MNANNGCIYQANGNLMCSKEKFSQPGYVDKKGAMAERSAQGFPLPSTEWQSKGHDKYAWIAEGFKQSPVPCSKNNDCQVGFMCNTDSSTCRSCSDAGCPVGVGCTTADDCGNGLSCVDNVCSRANPAAVRDNTVFVAEQIYETQRQATIQEDKASMSAPFYSRFFNHSNQGYATQAKVTAEAPKRPSWWVYFQY